MWDENRDGKITKKEMREAFRKLPKNRLAARTMVSVLFKKCEKTQGEFLTKEDFVKNHDLIDKITNMMVSSHYQNFMNKEDFPEMARCLAEAYNESRS